MFTDVKPYCQRCREDFKPGDERIWVFDKYYYEDHILVHDTCAYTSEVISE